MHKRISPIQPLHSPDEPVSTLHFSRREHGFSLVEVALAVAIVGFAFVALIGLLPAGMNTFKDANTSSSEMRIATDMTSLIQSTDYSKLAADLSFQGTIYFFDLEGGLLDNSVKPVAGYKQERIFAAKFIVGDQNIPAIGKDYDPKLIASKVLIAITRIEGEGQAALERLTTLDSIKTLPLKSKIRILPLTICKMDNL